MVRLSCIAVRIGAALVLALAAPAGSSARGDSGPLFADHNPVSEQQRIDLEQVYLRAYNGRNVALLDRILSEDYLYVGHDGTTVGKAAFVEGITRRPPGVTGATTVDFIRTYGDAGIVVALFTVTAGGRITEQVRFTDSCVRRGGRWYCGGQLRLIGTVETRRSRLTPSMQGSFWFLLAFVETNSARLRLESSKP